MKYNHLLGGYYVPTNYLPEKELNAKALEVSDNIHFRYGRHHRARYERGAKGVAFVFTHYIRSLLWTLSRYATEKDFTAFSRILGYTTLLGGASALPFYSAINLVYKEVTGDEEDLHKKLPDPLKKGLPAEAGIDLSDRVS